MREFFVQKKQKLRIESRVDTQPIWREKKEKHVKKESLSSREKFS